MMVRGKDLLEAAMKRLVWMIVALVAVYAALLILEGTGEVLHEVLMRYTPVKG